MSSVGVVLSPAPVRTPPRVAPGVVHTCVAAIYAAVVSATILHHEPWADEAQAWLLARDASLWELWTRLMHYEGSPGVWQTLLHALLAIGFPYSAYGFLSGALAFAAVVLLIRYSPLPLAARLLLPFTYFLCYQYAVIARSYSLIAPLLFTSAVLFRQAVQKTYLFTALLALLAGVSVHGFVLSICLWFAAYHPMLFHARAYRATELRKVAIATAVYGFLLLVFVVSAWPAKDVAFAEHRGLSNLQYLVDVTKASLSEAFTGEWISSLAVILLSIRFLWRGGGWLFFVPAYVVLCFFGTLVYAQRWHFGIVFLAWLLALWLSALRARIPRLTVIALGVVIACQSYWTVRAIAYDWQNRYSAGIDAAQYLKRLAIRAEDVYAIGYASTAIQPYFGANFSSNLNDGRPAAYWDWSKKNASEDPQFLFLSARKKLVVVGYRSNDERLHWSNLLTALGYEPERAFSGSTFWRSEIFEAESFDVYRRMASAAGSGLTNDFLNAPSLIVNAFSLSRTRLSPGMWATIYGANLAPSVRHWSRTDFTGDTAPHELESVSATVDGKPAVIKLVSPGEINLQIPTDSATGAVPLILKHNGVSEAYTITLSEFAPTLNQNTVIGEGTKKYLVAQFRDGSFVSPNHPAKPDDIVVIYGLGFGPLHKPIGTGRNSTGLNPTVHPVVFQIGSQSVTPIYAGAAPDMMGVYQFNVRIPEGTGFGDVRIDATVAGISTGQLLYLPIESRSLAVQASDSRR